MSRLSNKYCSKDSKLLFSLSLFPQDIADLALECSEGEDELQESVASKRLGRKVESIIDQLDSTLGHLEKDFVSTKANLDILKTPKQK